MHIHRQPIPVSKPTNSNGQYKANISRRNNQWCHKGCRNPYQQGGSRAHNEQVNVRSIDVTSRQNPEQPTPEAGLLSLQHAEEREALERASPMARGTRNDTGTNTIELVVATFNCENWKSPIIKTLIEDLSHNHTKNILLALQETWKYDVPKLFKRELGKKYHFIHESAMNAKEPRNSGRPYGGLCLIISKDIAFKIKYTNSRCLSVLLTDHNILFNNVYLPFNDSRKSVDENLRSMQEALGHLDAAHEITAETSNYMTVGDFNYAPTDSSQRKIAVEAILQKHGYKNSDISRFSGTTFSHKSGRLIDRIVSTEFVDDGIKQLLVKPEFLNSDHFPIMATLNVLIDNCTEPLPCKRTVNWAKASQKALESYSRLAEKECHKTLTKFKNNEINFTELYNELVSNIEYAAVTCIPKFKSTGSPHSHNIPMWRESMAPLKNDVEYWTQLQFLHGGPTRCPPVICQQLRFAKSRYRWKYRQLKREVERAIAEATTTNNCFKKLFKEASVPAPTVIEGHSTSNQPEMWRSHFTDVFKGKETPYDGTIISDIKINDTESKSFKDVSINEINTVVPEINTNKSYFRHSHWKNLSTDSHSAKQCLRYVLNNWLHSALADNSYFDWDLFKANVKLIPKKGKKDLSVKKGWRPISVGTSENWILEKILLCRLKPFLKTRDCQFGYKPKHGTNHAIEIVRILERSHDAHVCLLDASSAFDKLSWERIKDQLLKRRVPPTLVKIVLSQLSSNKISVCNTATFFARVGVKQGGVLSGVVFSCCYDDLVDEAEMTGAGILLASVGDKFKLICIIIYADDVFLMAASPNGLKDLISKAYIFANRYGDITFNPTKSCIMRLGPHRKPPVSVCGIPTDESYLYLGADIGRESDPQKSAAAKLYMNTNLILSQNPELRKCSISVKNTCIYSYGNVYSIENMLNVDSRLRGAHRYMTKQVHCDWTQFADLDGPNIRSRSLYCSYNLDSLEVIHRRRRNNFLIKASLHTNSIISDVIGNLARITV